jgi:hypothetical protein
MARKASTCTRLMVPSIVVGLTLWKAIALIPGAEAMDRAIAGPSRICSELAEARFNRAKDRIRVAIRGSKDAHKDRSAEPSSWREPLTLAEQEARSRKPAIRLKKIFLIIRFSNTRFYYATYCKNTLS